MIEIITLVFEFRYIHMHSFVISSLLLERCLNFWFMPRWPHIICKQHATKTMGVERERESQGNLILGKTEVEQIAMREQTITWGEGGLVYIMHSMSIHMELYKPIYHNDGSMCGIWGSNYYIPYKGRIPLHSWEGLTFTHFLRWARSQPKCCWSWPWYLK